MITYTTAIHMEIIIMNKKNLVIYVLFLQGHINLDSLGKRGYHIPKAGTLQVVRVMSLCLYSTICP